MLSEMPHKIENFKARGNKHPWDVTTFTCSRNEMARFRIGTIYATLQGIGGSTYKRCAYIDNNAQQVSHIVVIHY